MECTVSWTGALNTRSGMGFVAETGSGHTVVMDGAPDAAKPENGAVQGCTVKLSAERAEVDPKVFTAINMHFTVTGKGLPSTAVERAIAMSHEKYCSASVMLGKTAQITTSFEVVEI